MYEVMFYSRKVEERFNDVLDKLRSRPAEYNKAVAAFASLRISGPWRLTYTINDQRLVVVGLDVVDYHNKRRK